MGLAGFNTNLTDQLAFYGAYHHNKWNQLIHLIFVPAIMWSAFVWAAYTGSLVPWDSSAHLHFLPHWLSRWGQHMRGMWAERGRSASAFAKAGTGAASLAAEPPYAQRAAVKLPSQSPAAGCCPAALSAS